MQSYNNPKCLTNNDHGYQQQCFFETEQQEFEHQDRLHLEESFELKAVHRIVKQHLPANQLRTVRRPNKMVARTLFKQVPFYLLPKDLELPAQELVQSSALQQTLITKKTSTNGVDTNDNKSQFSLNSNQKASNLSQPQGNSLPIVKKIGPKLSNKDHLSISDYFSQSFFKCIYRKYKQSEKSANNNSKLSFHSTLNTQKMHCIQSLVDYNWKAFKDLQTQVGPNQYIHTKQMIRDCPIDKRNFLSKISVRPNSSPILNYVNILYKDKDKLKMMSENLAQTQQSKNSVPQIMQTMKLAQSIDPLNLKVTVDSNFQCGNLCYAFIHQDRPKDVYLFLENDTNTHGYNNWFFFRMRLMLQANHSQSQQISVRFHIMNMTKNSSMYKQGMLVSIFSMKKYIQNGQGWFKGGNNINLMSTNFERTNHPNEFFVSLSFEYKFQFRFNFSGGKTTDDEQIYFAMNKPYTYTRLIEYLIDYKKLSSYSNNDDVVQDEQEAEVQNGLGNQENRQQAVDQSTYIRLNTNNSICNINISDSDSQQEEKLRVRIKDPNGIRITDPGSKQSTRTVLQLSQNPKIQKFFKNSDQNLQLSHKYGAPKFFVQLKNIGFTLSNNIIPVITIGLGQKQQILKRKVILFLGRQHPSETMGSFVAQGIMNFFKISHSSFESPSCKSDYFPYDPQVSKFQHQSDFLLKNFQIVFLPMINPDGVIHGNSRCNFAGLDLNRRWDENTMKELTPQTYHLRTLILKLHLKNRITFMVDLHGHGKKLNSFIFASKSEKVEQKDKVSYRMFNYAISKLQPRFSLSSCTYGVSRDKQNTVRNQLYQLGVQHCYTLENSFYGYNTGGKIKHYTQRDFFEIGKSTILAIYAVISSNLKKQRERCLKKFGFNRDTLAQQLSIMADRFQRQQRFLLNDKQMLSESDPEGDVLNVQERLNVIKDTSKALSKKVKQSFYATTAVGFNLTKSKKTKNSKPNSKRQNSKLLKPTKQQIIRTPCASNLQMDKDSDQQDQQKKLQDCSNQQQKSFKQFIVEKKVSKYVTLSKKWTNRQKWNQKNSFANIAKQGLSQKDNGSTSLEIMGKQSLCKTFHKFQQRFNSKNQMPNFYETAIKKHSRHSKIKTQVSFVNQQNIKKIKISQQTQNFGAETLKENQNKHRRQYSKTKLNVQNGLTKTQNDIKYNMLKQESLRALLTDSLSILKIDPLRKGTKPMKQEQRNKGKSYSGYRMLSQNKKNNLKSRSEAYGASRKSDIGDGFCMTKHKCSSRQKFDPNIRNFSQQRRRCETQDSRNGQARDKDCAKKYKRFESFVQDKTYQLFHKQSKNHNNSVFYYFPVL